MEGVSQAEAVLQQLNVERARRPIVCGPEFRPESDYTRVEIVAARREFMPAAVESPRRLRLSFDTSRMAE